MSDDLSRRKSLTFAQAEGAAPLPSQLQPGELTAGFRARAWALFYTECERCTERAHGNMTGDWLSALQVAEVEHFNGMIDEFERSLFGYSRIMKPLFFAGDYVQVLGFLQFLVRDEVVGPWFGPRVEKLLVETRSAYRLIDNTLVPLASPDEGDAIRAALDQTEATGRHGARKHLVLAGQHATAGRWADSVRESIHAVEAVARSIEPSAELSKALARLERSARIHGGLRKGFAAIYGYSSNEQGIRHPLVDDDAAAVDETDALFMLGACASFVTYLIGKARTAGLLPP